uniref:Uncharacterized protein n=1 Tax=Juglanconis juglandina TaxID=1940567 RepID=A0A291LIQ4_9PEZI|nr:hypothetical protein [Juglanconis juglandina]
MVYCKRFTSTKRLHTTLSFYVWSFKIHISHSESTYSPIKLATAPRYVPANNVFSYIYLRPEGFNKIYEICTSGLRLSSVPAIMLLKLPTIIGFAETVMTSLALRQSWGPSP